MKSPVSRSVVEAIELRKLFSGGTLDTTFGSAGTASVSFKTSAGETANVAKIVTDLGGRTYVLATTGVGSGDRTTLQIRRLTAVGAIDTAWAPNKGNDVVFALDSSLQNVHGIPQIDALVDSTNRLVLLMGKHLYRFNVNGVFDSTFGNKGIATAAGMTAGAVVQADTLGHLYVFGTNVGSASSGAVIDRFTAKGVLDTTFSKDGRETITPYAPSGSSNSNQYAALMRVLPNNNVVLVAGSSYDDSNGTHIGIQAIRLAPTGVADAKYGFNGQVVLLGTDTNASTDEYTPGVIQAGGEIVLVRTGTSGGATVIQNELIASDGSRHATIQLGQNANDILGPGGLNNRPAQAILQADGSEIVVSNFNGSQLYKMTYDGVQGTRIFDSTFNNGSPIGSVDAAVLNFDTTITTAAQLGSGKVIAVKRIFRDERPVAQLSAKPLTASGTLTFSVVYRGPTPIVSSRITGNELRIVGASGQSVRPTLLGTLVLSDGSLLATYRTTNLLKKPFTAADNGTYDVRLLDVMVQDTFGDYATKRTLGQLTVAVS